MVFCQKTRKVTNALGEFFLSSHIILFKQKEVMFLYMETGLVGEKMSTQTSQLRKKTTVSGYNEYMRYICMT